MTRLALLTCAAIVANVSFDCSTPAIANDEPAEAPPLKTVAVEGVVVQVRSEGVLIRTDEGVDYLANVNPKRVYKKQKYADLPGPTVAVKGVGLPQHVVAGVFVDFEMDLTAQRVAKHVIPSVRVFTPNQQTVFGCFGRKENGGVKNQPTPFAQVGDGKWRIVGRITALRGNEVVVSVPNGTIRGAFANTPLVELEVADHRFAQPGDRAVLQGQTPQLPFVFATNLQIQRAAQPHMIPPKVEAGDAVAGVENGQVPRGRIPGGPAPDRVGPVGGGQGVVLPQLPPINIGNGEGGLSPTTDFGADGEAADKRPRIRILKVN